MQYYIRIDNRNVYVSEEIYKLYCKGERKERYFRESDIHNKTFYYNALDTEDFNGCDLFQDTRAKPVDEQAEEALERVLNKTEEAMYRSFPVDRNGKNYINLSREGLIHQYMDEARQDFGARTSENVRVMRNRSRKGRYDSRL